MNKIYVMRFHTRAKNMLVRLLLCCSVVWLMCFKGLAAGSKPPTPPMLIAPGLTPPSSDIGWMGVQSDSYRNASSQLLFSPRRLFSIVGRVISYLERDINRNRLAKFVEFNPDIDHQVEEEEEERDDANYHEASELDHSDPQREDKLEKAAKESEIDYRSGDDSEQRQQHGQQSSLTEIEEATADIQSEIMPSLDATDQAAEQQLVTALAAELARLFGRFTFKGVGVCVTKSVTDWRWVAVMLKLPLSTYYPNYDSLVQLPKVSLYLGCTYPPALRASLSISVPARSAVSLVQLLVRTHTLQQQLQLLQREGEGQRLQADRTAIHGKTSSRLPALNPTDSVRRFGVSFIMRYDQAERRLVSYAVPLASFIPSMKFTDMIKPFVIFLPAIALTAYKVSAALASWLIVSVALVMHDLVVGPYLVLKNIGRILAYAQKRQTRVLNTLDADQMPANASDQSTAKSDGNGAVATISEKAADSSVDTEESTVGIDTAVRRRAPELLSIARSWRCISGRLMQKIPSISGTLGYVPISTSNVDPAPTPSIDIPRSAAARNFHGAFQERVMGGSISIELQPFFPFHKSLRRLRGQDGSNRGRRFFRYSAPGAAPIVTQVEADSAEIVAFMPEHSGENSTADADGGGGQREGGSAHHRGDEARRADNINSSPDDWKDGAFAASVPSTA